MEKKWTYNLSCRLFADSKCFGPGIAQLLHLVQRLHSLRAAASEMEMAYSKAWTIVKNTENACGFKLLQSTAGGKGGGGAVLTEDALALLERYSSFCEELRTYGDALFAEKFKDYMK